jgi:hypothetical protein
MTYHHKASDTTLLFALHELGEEVQPADRVTVRRMLDERGLLEAGDFDRLADVASGRPAGRRSGAG